jgi:peptidylprolyl isomerase
VKALLLAAALGLVGPALAQEADPVVARGGGVTFTASQVRDMVRYADPSLRHALDTDPAALARYVRDRVIATIVLGEAHAQGWDARPDVAWQAAQAHDASIVGSWLAAQSAPDAAYPSDAQVEAAYAASKAQLMLPRQYHVAQIFIAASGAADAAADKRIQDARAQLRHGEFAAVARKLSQDRGSAANGGDLGWLPEDQMLPAIRTAVAGLTEDTVSDPVRTADGWHLLRLLGTRPAAPAPLAAVRAQIVQALRRQKQQENARTVVAALVAKQPVQIDEIALPQAVK